MDDESLQRVERVDLREVWQHEQYGFSRWLIANIDFLNEHLPFELAGENLSLETAAGDFAADVIAEATDVDSGDAIKVVIENQLETTDHDHLGKVLTYVAAFDARAAVWISAQARPEHAKAVQWLNDESSIDAWLFDVEVIRIAGSPAAPLLRQITGPSYLSRRAKAEKQADRVDKQQQEGFWSVVLPRVEDACRHHGVWQGRTASGNVHAWHGVPNSPGSIGWQMWVTAHGSWICLRVDAETTEEARFYFDQLQDQAETIESDFGQSLEWIAKDNQRACLLRWDNPTPGGYRDGPEDWEAAAEPLAEAMERLVATTAKPVAELDSYTAEPSSDESDSREL